MMRVALRWRLLGGAIGRNHYETAKEAADEARRSEVEKCSLAGRIDPKKPRPKTSSSSHCLAVLAFSIWNALTVSTCIGKLVIGEYAYAAPKLGHAGRLYQSGPICT